MILLCGPVEVANTSSCHAVFAPITILNMVKFVLECHRLRGCHRLPGYLGMLRGRLHILNVNLLIMTRAPTLLGLWRTSTISSGLRHAFTS